MLLAGRDALTGGVDDHPAPVAGQPPRLDVAVQHRPHRGALDRVQVEAVEPDHASMADVADGAHDLGLAVGEVVLRAHDAQGAGADAVGDERGALADQVAGALDVLALDLLDGGGAAAARGGEHAGRHPLDDVAQEAARHLAGAHGHLGGLDRAARVVAEHDDERAVEHADAELERAEHAGVDDVAGGADDEQVAEALVEDDLGGHPRVGAAEEDRERVLLGGDPVPEVHVLVRVGPLVGHEPGVARGQHAPGLLGRAGPRPRLRAVPLDHGRGRYQRGRERSSARRRGSRAETGLRPVMPRAQVEDRCGSQGEGLSG